MPDELLDLADELYALGLGEFTLARDARAKALKGSDLAKPVRSLKKPSLAAWVVNLLVRHESEQVEQVLEMGAALRLAQAAMSGADLRALTRQRRQLTAAVTTRARALAAEHGQRVTQSVADQVEATLTAAMVDEQCAHAVRSGLLVTALSATGVDPVELDAAVALPEALGFTATPREAPQPGRPDLHVVPDPEAEQKAVAAAQGRAERTEAELARAAEALASAVADVEELEARTMQVHAEMEELKRRLAELETSLEEIDDELSDAEDVRAEAEDSVAAATREQETAAAALARLTPN